MSASEIYLDYQATTPLDPRVAAVMRPYLDTTAAFGNPHSADHGFGHQAAATVEAARQTLAASIGSRPSQVLFTSGATEANNTALKGLLQPRRAHIIVAATEHACVLAAARRAESCTALTVDTGGILDPDALAAAIGSDTAMVSVMLVNNEIGVIQPIARIAEVCHQAGVLLHCDAAQALGRVPVDVDALDVDLLSLSGHKIYGPKGIGALYIRRGVRLNPLLDGGGQEHGIRSGTLSPMLCVGMARAAEIAHQEYAADQQRAAALIQDLQHALDSAKVHYAINGDTTRRIRDNLNLHFPGYRQSDFMTRLRGLAVSSASACSGGGAHSHVLDALGHDAGTVAANIRLCVGRPTTIDDIAQAAKILIQACQH